MTCGCKKSCCEQAKQDSCCNYDDGLDLPADVVGTWNLATTTCDGHESVTTYGVLSLHEDGTATLDGSVSESTKLGEWYYHTDNCVKIYLVGVEEEEGVASYRSVLQAILKVYEKDHTLRAVTAQVSKYALDDLALEDPLSTYPDCCANPDGRICVEGAKVLAETLADLQDCKKKRHH